MSKEMEKTKTVMLLDLWPSMFGMRARLALAEKKVDFEYKEQDVFNKPPELLQMNPIHKKVPVLVHSGKTICESLIILEYIEEVWKDGAPLLPSDPYSRANARFWANYIDSKLYFAGRKMWATEGQELEKGRKEVIESLKLLEGELGEKEYLGGERFGYLDIALLGFAPWFKAYGTYGGFSVDDVCPKLTAWAKRCAARPSAARWLAKDDEVLAFTHELRVKHGLK